MSKRERERLLAAENASVNRLRNSLKIIFHAARKTKSDKWNPSNRLKRIETAIFVAEAIVTDDEASNPSQKPSGDA